MVSFTVHDLATHAGRTLEQLETLAHVMSTGSELVFSARTVRKRSGGIREIFQPTRILSPVSKNLYRSFLSELPYRPHDAVHGFVEGRSTLSNARTHLSATCVLRVDLEDFFPSIRADVIEETLQRQGYDEKAAALCTRLVAIERKLPIGLSTSPFLSNVVFDQTDRQLACLAAERGLVYTRYADDLVFSPNPTDADYAAISDLLNAEGWSINTRKTAFMRAGGPQYVTGLYVGTIDSPRLPRALKRRLRWVMHHIVKFGYEAYMEEFGGLEDGMFPPQLRGYGFYFAGVEPDIGVPLLKLIDEHVPDVYRPDRFDFYVPDVHLVELPADDEI